MIVFNGGCDALKKNKIIKLKFNEDANKTVLIDV